MNRGTRWQPLRASSARRCAARGFTMAEMLIVMAIMSILAASLVVLVPRLRSNAMVKAAGSDIHRLSMVITEFFDDRGFYPNRNYAPSPIDSPTDNDYMDYVLFKSLTDPDYDPSGSGTGKGWGMARDDWDFLRGDSKGKCQFLDPWGVPYYYVPNTHYLLGVRINDSTDGTPLVDDSDPDSANHKALPNCYGTTPAADDFRDATASPDDWDHLYPDLRYYGPPPDRQAFYNATTFQIHSKGPDQKTDYYDDRPDLIDALDRGCDPDDINNFGGGSVSK